MAGRLLALLMTLIMGCAPVMTCDELSSIPSSIEIGQGERRFHDLESGDAVQRHWGTQGGSHVYFAVKAFGLNPGQTAIDAPEMYWTVVDDEGRLLAAGETGYQPFAGTGKESELTGITSVQTLLDWDEYSEYMASNSSDDEAYFPVTVTVQAEDSCGTVVEDQRKVLFSLF